MVSPKIIPYCIGGFLILMSLIVLFQGFFLSFISLSLSGLILMPPITEAIGSAINFKINLAIRIIACLVFFMIGASLGPQRPMESDTSVSVDESQQETLHSEYGGVVITAKELGEDYPLTNEYCEVICRNMQVYVYADGEMYAINGTATGALSNGKAVFRNATVIDDSEIWAYNLEEGEEINEYSIKKSISLLISRGLELCD